MTENVWARVRHGDAYVTVSPTDGDKFLIEVTDALSREVGPEARREACRHLLEMFSAVRQQIFFDELDGKTK